MDESLRFDPKAETTGQVSYRLHAVDGNAATIGDLDREWTSSDLDDLDALMTRSDGAGNFVTLELQVNYHVSHIILVIYGKGKRSRKDNKLKL